MDDFFCDAPGESKSTVLGAVYIGDVEAGYTRNDMENAGTGKADCWAACDRWDATYQEELGQAGCNHAVYEPGTDSCSISFISKANWNGDKASMFLDTTGTNKKTTKIFCRDNWCAALALWHITSQAKCPKGLC